MTRYGVRQCFKPTALCKKFSASESQPRKDDEQNANGAHIVPPSLSHVEVEGILLPKRFETNRPLPEHVECLKALEMREDDVVLMAYPKSGTHWIWEVISMLLSGKAEYEKRAKQLAMMEATSIENIQSQPSPRVLNTHLPIRLLPRQIQTKKVKVVHVYRNVKDLFVSMYFHFGQWREQEAFTLEGFMDTLLSDRMPAYFTYMKDMYEYQKNNPDLPVFLVSFEDTKEDPEKVIRQIAEFLGVEASPELVKGIAEATNINKMREANKQKQQRTDVEINFYRKGEVGDWKNHLTVAQSERLDAAMTQLESCDYNFRFTL